MKDTDDAYDAAAVIAAVEGNGDDVYPTLPIGWDVANDILEALELAGFDVIRIVPRTYRPLEEALADIDARRAARRSVEGFYRRGGP